MIFKKLENKGYKKYISKAGTEIYIKISKHLKKKTSKSNEIFRIEQDKLRVLIKFKRHDEVEWNYVAAEFNSIDEIIEHLKEHAVYSNVFKIVPGY